MNQSSAPTLFFLAAALSTACGSAPDVSRSDAGAPTPSREPGQPSGSGGSGALHITPDESCPTLCEQDHGATEVSPTEGGCLAAEWAAGIAYGGGQTVSLAGYEYTSNYWTDTSPAVESGPSGSGKPWSEGMACGEDGSTTERLVKLVCCEGSESGDSSTEAPGMGTVGDFLDEALFNELFPNRDNFYSFGAFVEAAVAFPGFSGQGSDEVRKRELAAFLANIAHETTGGWPDAPGGPQAWGLYFLEENGCEGGCPGYCIPTPDEPCMAGKSYHGRGPIQLSYNYNYGPAGSAIGTDILAEPELVSSDAVIAFQTAIWFWMEGLSGGTNSPHDAIISGLGFGETIRIINGIECNGGRTSAVDDRVAFFEMFTARLEIGTGSNLRC